MTSKPLTREQYELWLKIKDLAKQRADETGVFPMTYREISQFVGSERAGKILVGSLEKRGLIVMQGTRWHEDAFTGRRLRSFWRLTVSELEFQRLAPPVSVACSHPEPELWDAIRHILIQWAYDDRQLKEVAAFAGYKSTLSVSSMPLGWFLSMSWVELLKLRRLRRVKTGRLLAVMCSLAEWLNPDAVSAHSTYRRLAEQASVVTLPQDADAAAWNRARELLRQCGKTLLTLTELAEAMGLPWPYDHGNWPLDDLLDRSWSKLRISRRFRGHKLHALLALVSRAAKDMSTVERALQQKAAISLTPARIDAQIRALGLDRDMPIDLLFLSIRAKRHLRSQGMNDLGAVLGYLAGTDLKTLSAFRFVGNKTALELMELLQAVRELDLDKLREFLPLRAEGKGFGYAAYAKHCLSEFIPRNRNWLFHYFVLGQKLEDIAIQSDVVSSCVGKHTRLFRQCLEKALAYFPDEERRIREAWERGEPIANAINWEMDETDRATICAVLDKVLRSISEPEGTNAEQDRMFVTWWKQLQQLPEFSGEGVSLSQFLQDRGHPELLAQFIQYLDTKPLAYYCGLTGTVAHIYAYHWSKQ